MTSRRKAATRGGDRSQVLARALLAVLAIAVLVPGRSLAADLGSVGLLWLPDSAAPPTPMAVVIALHDSTGIDRRGWHYGGQLTAAGITVLHIEVLETSADGFSPAVAADDATAARAPLTTAMRLLAADPRFATASVGLLAFGEAGQVALLGAADPAHGDRIAGLALLYPGCAALAATATAERTRPRSPILLLHGDVDPANLPAACSGLERQLARSAPVIRRQYAGAGYAWDLAPHGPHERMKLPWPGRPGLVIAVSYWPEAAELAATQVAAFFAASFAAHRQ
jgi:dienelactone hydrolase